MKEIDLNEFDVTITENGVKIIDCYADWCHPCKTLKPILEEISSEFPDIGVSKINVDKFPEIMERVGARNIPTVLFYKDGTLVDKVSGTKPKSFYVDTINNMS